MIKIIISSKICFLSMADENGMPYNLPFNFGYQDNYIYLHSGLDGKKIDILKNNPNVCIAFSNSEELAYQSEKVACSYFMRYKSVLVFGKVEFIEDYHEKEKALGIVMKQYTGKEDFTYNTPSINNVLCFRVSTENMTGKMMGY
ncbi:MAG: MFS transporter [Bacteroidetes bacterium HGW-Bacteroidetes-6]|nr:MAG: MFS transporter [Bacteroidetes bacterium HGW-Bacteroidetes-6]